MGEYVAGRQLSISGVLRIKRMVNGFEDAGMNHVRGAPNHPQTQGKIEGWHQTLKNRILLENYLLNSTELMEGQPSPWILRQLLISIKVA